jgi:hypothetical protein
MRFGKVHDQVQKITTLKIVIQQGAQWWKGVAYHLLGKIKWINDYCPLSFQGGKTKSNVDNQGTRDQDDNHQDVNLLGKASSSHPLKGY